MKTRAKLHHLSVSVLLICLVTASGTCRNANEGQDSAPSSELDRLSAGGSRSVAVKKSSGSRSFLLEINSPGTYILETSGSLDVSGALYDSQQRPIQAKEDGGRAENFRMSMDLDAGQYTVEVSHRLGRSLASNPEYTVTLSRVSQAGQVGQGLPSSKDGMPHEPGDFRPMPLPRHREAPSGVAGTDPEQPTSKRLIPKKKSKSKEH